MSENQSQRGPRKLGAIKRQTVSVSDQALVTSSYLAPGQSLPLVIQPSIAEINIVSWGRSNQAFVEEQLLKHGAILFRGFNVASTETFQEFIAAVSGGALEYRERSSPRHEVSDRIYTSTDYPADQPIFLHNEHSYAKTFPLKLFFYCAVPAQEQGETPIADCRKVYARISPNVRERFERNGWMYVRNFGDGFGLPWQTVFQTSDRAEVEEYCRQHQIIPDWKDGNRLRTRQVRPIMATHPRARERSWFNHATFFHVSTLPATVRADMLAEFAEEDLPNNTYYGDGSPIEPEVMDELRAAYEAETIKFPWQAGDILLLDNMLTAHGRSPFSGPRKVLVGMADPFTREDV